MWMLFILSMNYNGDMKVTQYDHYKDKIQCQQMWRKVSNAFQNDEIAFCHYVEYLKPKDLPLPKN
jgi:hypothetical protein